MVYRTNIMNNKKLQNGEKFEKTGKKVLQINHYVPVILIIIFGGGGQIIKQESR